MEELLNKLIEKGWKPFYGEIKSKWGTWGNYPQGGVIKIKKRTCFISYRYESRDERRTKRKKVQHSLRELVSKESGLWQFVCENGMIDKQKEEILIEFYDNLRGRTNVVYDDVMYEYRLIESALCDEDKLEQFLLDNIKIDKEYTEEEQELLDLDYGTGYTKKFVK